MKIFEDTEKLEAFDQPTLVNLCLHYMDVIERLVVVVASTNTIMNQNATAFNAAGNELSATMRLILDDTEKVGPGIVGASPSPSKN